jgi:hypothetical protein
LTVLVKLATMEIDRKTVVQIVVAAGAVGLFIAALIGVSSAYGTTVAVENESLDGTMSGTFTEFNESNGTVTGELDGTYEDDFEEMISGSVENGTLDGDTLTAEFNGTISGAIDGTISGEMNGTIQEDGDEVSFDGSFTGSASGETKTELSSTGGLALIAIIVAYIVGLPLLGYLIERHDFEDE